MSDGEEQAAPRPPRRKRYSGRNPRGWDEKYKEHRNDPTTLTKVLASGKTPAGTHRPIMVAEILDILRPQVGEIGVDCTLGFGGHAEAILPLLQPGGKLMGIDADPIQLPQTTERLRRLGFAEDTLSTVRSNFAGLPKVLADLGCPGVDFLLADLGVSSMQIDNPTRGFSYKSDGPLDMRMNPQRGQSVSDFLSKTTAAHLEKVLTENADEPHASMLAARLAGHRFVRTGDLVRAIRGALGDSSAEAALPRVFQALRIAVNDEFSALDTLLRQIPACLKPQGRAAILTFHSGEDRRVKKAFANGLAAGTYSEIATGIIRPGPSELRENPRSSPAKLRWAIRSAGAGNAGGQMECSP